MIMQSAIYRAAKNKIFVSIRLKAYTNTLSKDKYSSCGSMCLSCTKKLTLSLHKLLLSQVISK